MSGSDSDSHRLNPFALAPETNARFNLLLAFALLLVLQMTPVLLKLWGYEREFITVAEKQDYLDYLEASGVHDRLEGEEQSDLLNALIRYHRESIQADWQVLLSTSSYMALPVGLCVLTLLVAYTIYRWYPGLIKRRNHLHPLTQDVDPQLFTAMNELVIHSGLQKPPRLMLGGDRPNGQAFGTASDCAIRLGKPMRLMLRKAPHTFRAIVLHELGHIANRDVGRTYFTQGLWVAVSGVVLIPCVIAIIARVINRVIHGELTGLSVATALWFLVSIGVLFAVLLLIRAGLLRVREQYADWKAVVWGGEAGLLGILGQMSQQESSRSGWRGFLTLHPSARERLQVLKDPANIFRMGTEIPLVTGFLVSLLFTAVNGSEGWFDLVWTAAASLWSIARSSILILGSQMVGQYGGVLAAVGITLVAMGVILAGILLLLFLCSPLLVIVFILVRGIGLQVEREAVLNVATHRRNWRDYLRLGQAALLMTVGAMAAAFFAPVGPFLTILFAPSATLTNTLFSVALLLVWGGLFCLFTMIWLLYTHIMARQLLGKYAGAKGPYKREMILIFFSTTLLLPLYLPLAFALPTISLPSVPDAVTAMGGANGMWIGLGVLIFFLCIISFLSIATFTYLLTFIWHLIRKPRCPQCGQPILTRYAAGEVCTTCSSELAAWLLV